MSLIRSNTTLHGVGLASLLHEPRVHAYMADLIRRIADGELEAVIDRVFPWPTLRPRTTTPSSAAGSAGS